MSTITVRKKTKQNKYRVLQSDEYVSFILVQKNEDTKIFILFNI